MAGEDIYPFCFCFFAGSAAEAVSPRQGMSFNQQTKFGFIGSGCATAYPYFRKTREEGSDFFQCGAVSRSKRLMTFARVTETVT